MSAGESFRDRLARLRRERDAVTPKRGESGQGRVAGPAAPGPAAPGGGGLPPWLGARLAARARGRIAREPEVAKPLETTGAEGGGQIPGAPQIEALLPHRGLPRALQRSPCGGFWQRHHRLPVAARHGHLPLALALDAEPFALAFLGKDERLVELDPGRAVYLDIETTGLSGGAGTWPYLVALGAFESGPDGLAFAVWQGFLETPHEERALLLEVAARVEASAGLVSFFGKSFDRHRLEDKMRLHGIRAPFAERPHLDLYHPLRRLYGSQLPNVRLGTLERQLLGLSRPSDLPGSQAPAAWFDFLAGRSHRLEEVFEHNRVDVVSLAALLAHLGRTLEGTDAVGQPLLGPAVARARALGALWESKRRFEESAAAFEQALRLLQAEPQDPRGGQALLAQELSAHLDRVRARAQSAQRAGGRAPKGPRVPKGPTPDGT